MEVYVFSYNRGKYLRNCLESLQRHAHGIPISVIDDGSTDPATIKILDDYAGAITVISRSDADSDVSLGGLYANMNWVIRESNSDLVLFIQDDMQLVRDITAEDYNYIIRFFEHYPRSIELHTCFTKSTTRTSVGSGVWLDDKVPVYLLDPGSCRRVWHSDVGIFHLARMRQFGIELRDSESQNEEYLRGVVDRMGLSPWPFMMWLPFPESVKFRHKGLLQRYAEWRAGAGLYPFRPMSAEKVRQLMERELERQPIAEDYLDCIGLSRTTPWMYDNAAKFYRLPKKVLKWKRRRRGESKRKKLNKGSAGTRKT